MSISIVAVRYLEPEYKQTLDCLNKVPCPIIFVDRKGVGSLAEAYNRGFKKVQTDYVWFISNIVFKENVLTRLMENIKPYAGIHPNFDSHHKFMRYGKGIQRAKFIEFTAPLIKSQIFEEIQLDENLPYWGHDIVFGMECEQKGYTLAVDHTTKIDHTYIWDSKEHPVTLRRKQLRVMSDKATEFHLDKYYPRWKQYL